MIFADNKNTDNDNLQISLFDLFFNFNDVTPIDFSAQKKLKNTNTSTNTNTKTKQKDISNEKTKSKSNNIQASKAVNLDNCELVDEYLESLERKGYNDEKAKELIKK